MAFLKGLFDFGKPLEPGPSVIMLDLPAPDDERGVGWKDPDKMDKLIEKHSALINENWLELVCLCDFIKGHIMNHNLDESVHLAYQQKCKDVLLSSSKSKFPDDKKIKLLGEIVSTIEDIDFDKYPNTARNLKVLMFYITTPNSKGLYMCKKSLKIRERLNVEGAVISILREKDNPNFVFDENNRFIKDWESNYPRIYESYTNWQKNLDDLAAQEKRNLGQQL